MKIFYILILILLTITTSNNLYAQERRIYREALDRLHIERETLLEQYPPEVLAELDSRCVRNYTYSGRLNNRLQALKNAEQIITDRLNQLPASELDNDAIRPHVIYIDPGHGGNDPGAAISDASIENKRTYIVTENEMNLRISKLVRDKLEKKGYTVIMSRETVDEGPSLYTRSALCRAINPDIAVSIHLNSSEFAFPIFDRPDTALPEMNYTRVYVWGPSQYDFLIPFYTEIHHDIQQYGSRPLSVRLAQVVADALRESLSLDFRLSDDLTIQLAKVKELRKKLFNKSEIKPAVPDFAENILAELMMRYKRLSDLYKEDIAALPGVSGQDIHMVREIPHTPSVLVEAVFLSNPAEQNVLLNADRTEQIALGIYNGIMKYFSDSEKTQ